MNLRTTTRTQASAFGLAALMTLALLGSIDQLATLPAPDAQIARIEGAATPVHQVIVITGQRLHG